MDLTRHVRFRLCEYFLDGKTYFPEGYRGAGSG